MKNCATPEGGKTTSTGSKCCEAKFADKKPTVLISYLREAGIPSKEGLRRSQKCDSCQESTIKGTAKLAGTHC